MTGHLVAAADVLQSGGLAGADVFAGEVGGFQDGNSERGIQKGRYGTRAAVQAMADMSVNEPW
jgi:hypothetical protein